MVPTDVGQRRRPRRRARSGSAILYLLVAGEVSAWHRLTDADELWSHHQGAPLTLWTSADGDEVTERTLGPDVLAGEAPQAVVPAGCWQSARSTGAHTLVSCSVVPEFRFEGFELAPDGWAPGRDPADRSARPDRTSRRPLSASATGLTGAEQPPVNGSGAAESSTS